MAKKEFPLAVVIRGVDRVTAPMQRIQGALFRFDKQVGARFRATSNRLGLPVMTEAAGRFGSALGDLGRRASMVAGAVGGITAAAAGLGVFAVRSLVATASEFERFRAVLTTLEGSSAAADKSMRWVSEFASRTPYEMAQVMDSFVKLRAYGIDPTDGTLRTLGDTASSMQKPVMDAVEALADAMTGENERLKEFGIRARKEGDRIVYEYSKDGKQLQAVAQAGNRAMIQSTLMAIWNDRYGGAMKRQAGTWSAMLSNLSDRFDDFKRRIMASGAFDWLKSRLGDLLARIDAMAQSGELQRLAEIVGQKLVRALQAAWRAGEALVKAWPEIVATARPIVDAIGWLVDRFGAAKVIIGAVVGAVGLFLVPALYATATAFYAFGVAILTTPVGWILAAVVAIAAGAYLIYKNWGPITEFFGAWWQAVKGVFGAVVDFFAGIWANVRAGFEGGFINGLITLWKTLNPVALIMRAFTELGPNIIRALTPYWNKLRSMFGGLVPDWARDMLGISEVGAGRSNLGAAAIGRAERGTTATNRSEVMVDLRNLPPGTRVEHRTDSPDFELNQGFAMGMS